MRVELVASTPNPEHVVTMAASVCYSSDLFDKVFESSGKEKKQEHLIKYLIDNGHESPLEHVSFTFYIEGIDRAATHQLVRHRVASFSQRSQRYTSQFNDEYTVPPTIKGTEYESEYHSAMAEIFNHYNKLVEAGIPKEDARYLLPNASNSTIMCTMNLREIRHFLNLRMCNRAQYAIRMLAIEMYKLINKDHPLLMYKAGPNCWLGKCNEQHKTSECPLKKI